VLPREKGKGGLCCSVKLMHDSAMMRIRSVCKVRKEGSSVVDHQLHRVRLDDFSPTQTSKVAVNSRYDGLS
jgi:hypothetical protein